MILVSDVFKLLEYYIHLEFLITEVNKLFKYNLFQLSLVLKLI